MPQRDVLICDVAPRDGLQIEDRSLSSDTRVELCRRLASAGLGRVEVASFVHPERVPTMAGAEEVVAGVAADAECEWTGLILNERGYDRALTAGLSRVNYTLAVTEAFSQRNQGCTRSQAEAVAVGLAQRARADGIKITFTLAVSFGCPFEGRVPESEPLVLASRLAASQPDELVFADTIGVAVPNAVSSLLLQSATLGARVGAHFHDTRGTGIANCAAAFASGCRLFDASVGGSGGCPFAPGATGNVATEDLIYLFEEMGIDTGVNLEGVRETSRWLSGQLGHVLPGAVTRAGGFPDTAPLGG
jgi:isopropylmalate/homocitrate/citramalate synthase